MHVTHVYLISANAELLSEYSIEKLEREYQKSTITEDLTILGIYYYI